MKRSRTYLFFVFTLLLLLPAWSQVLLTGIVVSKTGPLPGATIKVLKPDSTFISGTSTGEDGTFTLSVAANSKVILQCNLLSYKTRYKDVESGTETMEVLRIFMREDIQSLNEVEVKTTQVRGDQKGDTTQFNSAAYKTNPDATAEDLIKKMPGVTSDNSGVKVNGETVQKVLVDGKPFFGDDPNAALKNVPADIIDRVEIFDKQSDQSQFTGFNDGNQQKTINLVTKKGRNSGKFGRVYGGAGADENSNLRYTGGATINSFNEKRRVSLLLLSNNVNQQNFSMSDISGAMGTSGQNMGRGGPILTTQGQNGNTTTQSAGLNYSDVWGKKITFSGSYFYNYSDNKNTATVARNYFSDDRLVYLQSNDNSNVNQNHRLNARLEYNIDSLNKLTLTTSANLQDNRALNLLQASNSIYETILKVKTNTNSKANVLGADFTNNALYQRKLKKEGRTFSLGLVTTLNERNNKGSYYSNNFYNDTTSTGLDQIYTTYSYDKRVLANAAYTEPLNKVSQIQINYNPSYALGKSDKSTNDYNGVETSYNLFNGSLSNQYNTTYSINRGGLTYRYNKNKLNLSFGAEGQVSSLNGIQKFPYETNLKQQFKTIIPNAMFNYKFNKSKNIRVYYRASTNVPSLNQLQNVIDISNPLQIRSGNSALKQTFDNSINIRYGGFDSKTSRNFMVFTNANTTSNYIGNATYLLQRDTVLQGTLIKAGAQLSKPTNFNGYYNSRTFLTYGFPLKFIKSNLNLNAGFTYNRSPSIINNLLNYSNSYGTNGGLYLGSNISANLDFSIGYNASYTSVKNTKQQQSNNSYFTHGASLKLNWIIYKGLVINTDVTNTLYNGLSQNFNQNYWLWNAYLGYKFLKDKSLEAKISVFDILNQNRSINRTINSNYTEDSYTNVLKRYGLFSVTYTFKKFKGLSTAPKPEENPNPYPGGPPPGMRPPHQN